MRQQGPQGSLQKKTWLTSGLKRGNILYCLKTKQTFKIKNFEIKSCSVAQNGLERGILLPQPPRSWHYGYVPSHMA